MDEIGKALKVAAWLAFFAFLAWLIAGQLS
jgi:hypothetical protein